MQLLVICVGNICRSPYAAACLQVAHPAAQVISAGLGALIDHPADPLVQQLAAEQGLDLSRHVARQVLAEQVREADLVLTMSLGQQQELITRFPFARGRVFRLGHWIGQDIPDPYQHPETVHRQVQAQIREGVATWSTRLASLMGKQ